MSHFTQVQTEMKDENYLIGALKEMGLKPQVGAHEVPGWGGTKTSVDISVPTKGTGGRDGYRIGFKKGKGGYEIVADWWGVRQFRQQEFQDTLTQNYALALTKAKLQRQRFRVNKETKDSDGAIHLLVSRMA